MPSTEFEENVQKERETMSAFVTVGLDLSLCSSGFCLLDGDNVTVETVKTTPKTCENDLARFAYIRKEIIGRIPSNVDMICVEDFFAPFGPSAGSAISLAMLGAVIRVALWEATMPFYVVSPNQLKKHVTGKGAGQKSVVLREVYKKYGIDCKDDNQADAAALAHIARDLLTGASDDWPEYRKEVMKKIEQERPSYNITLLPA